MSSKLRSDLFEIAQFFMPVISRLVDWKKLSASFTKKRSLTATQIANNGEIIDWTTYWKVYKGFSPGRYYGSYLPDIKRNHVLCDRPSPKLWWVLVITIPSPSLKLGTR